MRGVDVLLGGTCRVLYWISGISLIFLMFLTVADVVGRVFNRPIEGVYDLTLILAGIIVAFAVPYATRRKVHVKMEFVVDAVSPGIKKLLSTLTRFMGILFFLLVGWNLLGYGMRLYTTGEVSQTIHLPLFPFVLSMGVVCLFNCLVIMYQLVLVLGGKEE